MVYDMNIMRQTRIPKPQADGMEKFESLATKKKKKKKTKRLEEEEEQEEGEEEGGSCAWHSYRVFRVDRLPSLTYARRTRTVTECSSLIIAMTWVAKETRDLVISVESTPTRVGGVVKTQATTEME